METPQHHPHIELLQSLLVLAAPRQALLSSAPFQGIPDLVALHKHLQVHEGLDPFLFRQCPGALTESVAQQIIDQQPIQAHPRPLVVLDVRQTRDLVEVLKVLDSLRGMLLDDLLLLVQGFQFPLQPLHPCNHAVERGEGVGHRLAADGGIGGEPKAR